MVKANGRNSSSLARKKDFILMLNELTWKTTIRIKKERDGWMDGWMDGSRGDKDDIAFIRRL